MTLEADKTFNEILCETLDTNGATLDFKEKAISLPLFRTYVGATWQPVAIVRWPQETCSQWTHTARHRVKAT